jgi:ACS family hexuronate transporter-like MFS transporter
VALSLWAELSLASSPDIMLGHDFTCATLFFVGIFHLIGFLAILLFVGRIQPLSAIELQRIESVV